MILTIGNKRGFTFVEVLITTVILALGSVLIYSSFFISLDAFQHYFNYLNVSSWADEKIWIAQDELARFGIQAKIDPEGQLINRNENFKWNLTYDSIDQINGLYRIELVISWREGRRSGRLLRSAYAVYKKE